MFQCVFEFERKFEKLKEMMEERKAGKGERENKEKKKEEIQEKNFSSFFLLVIVSAFNGWPAPNHMWTEKP